MGEARPRRHTQDRTDEQVEHRVARERAKNHLHPGRLGQRARGLQDHLQRQDDQADADGDAADLADAGALARQVQDHAAADREGRKPRQVEREQLNHEARCRRRRRA
jgi:hypothetical protein